jgi:hypothetical protein
MSWFRLPDGRHVWEIDSENSGSWKSKKTNFYILCVFDFFDKNFVI